MLLMLQQFPGCGLDHTQIEAGTIDRAGRQGLSTGFRTVAIKGKGRLPTGHCQIDVSQQMRIQQRTVEFTTGVVDVVTLAERVQAVALTGMQTTRETQRIDDRTDCSHGVWRASGSLELGIEKAHIEVGIVDDQLGTGDESEEILGDLAEARLSRSISIEMPCTSCAPGSMGRSGCR